MRFSALIRCSASIGALIFAATPAFAQEPAREAPPTAQDTPADNTELQQEADLQEPEVGPEGGEIVVTGIRASLRSAQNLRRNSDQIVDAVVAEDIGKLPDINTAQTAARIPGVQVYRQGGEAQNVLVRGLPNFTTTYNGREIFTAETRVVALQDFPSANIAALEVFKTSSAELVEPGLAGLINVRSRRPFDFSEGQISASVWGLYTVQAGALTPNFNALITDRWEVGEGDFGILLNVSYTELEYLDSEPSNTDFLQTFSQEGNRLICCGPANPSQAAARFPDIQRLFYRTGNRARPSVTAAAQWRPNDNLEFYADFLYQGFRNEVEDRRVDARLFGGTYSNLVYRPGTNLLSSGTVTGPGEPVFTFQGATLDRTTTFQYAGGAVYENGPLRLAVDLARTETAFRGEVESLDRLFTPREGTIIDFDLETPGFTIRGVDPFNINSYVVGGLFELKQKATGQDWQARFDADYTFSEFGFLRSLEAGLRYSNRDADRVFGTRFGGVGPNVPASSLPLQFQITRPGFVGVDRGNFFDSFLSPTYASIRGQIPALRQFIIDNGGTNFTIEDLVPPTLFEAEEETFAAYAQLNFGLGETFEGNIGVRLLNVKTRVAGPVPTGIDVIDEGTESDAILPNASIRWRPTEQLQFRAAVSKTVTRPNFSDLVPSITLGPPPAGGIGTDSDPRRGTGGNPFLQPFESTNFDVAAEYYFGRTSFAAITLFQRNIQGFIQPSTFRFTDPALGVVEITGPTNAGAGSISGAEFQFQAFADFSWVPEWARGFGVQANLTYLDAATEQPDGAGGLVFLPITDQLNGVSEWNYNLVGIYEREGFSVRLTYNGRSEYSASRQLRGNDIYLETAFPADRLDLSINYDIVPNATVFFDWTNITQDPFRQTFSSARDGATRAEYIRYLRYDETTLSLGVRFRL